MNVLLIGSGGREHALAIKIAESVKLTKLYCAPGNPGIGKVAELVQVNTSDSSAVIEFCKKHFINLVVIGPEQPLVDGLADDLRKNEINVFGPDKEAARIEGDKAFSKWIMKKYDIPTAAYEVFIKSDKDKALSYLKTISYPIVIKASGLAAGKGVAICQTQDEAEATVLEYFEDDKFGESGHTIVIEEFMDGEEASIFAITDGKDYVVLPSAQDHKRALDGDKGKNTGGMGAYAPAPIVTETLLERIKKEVIEPTLAGMEAEGKRYSGCLYCGLMIKDGKPRVVEFNCRFGDPETQVVLPIVSGDFLELLNSAAEGHINVNSVAYTEGAAVCVVAASGGYPDEYKKGFPILGLDKHDDDVIVYHAGTKKEGSDIVTNGGRVLGVTAYSKQTDVKYCINKAYDAISKICFDGITYRKDIAFRALNR